MWTELISSKQMIPQPWICLYLQLIHIYDNSKIKYHYRVTNITTLTATDCILFSLQSIPIKHADHLQQVFFAILPLLLY